MPPFILIDGIAFNLNHIACVNFHVQIEKDTPGKLVPGVAIWVTTHHQESPGDPVLSGYYDWNDVDEPAICAQIRQYFTLHSATDIPAD